MSNEFGKYMENEMVKAWKAFMWNEQNEFNCSECPENTSGKYRGCGQQNCWVSCHMRSGKENA